MKKPRTTKLERVGEERAGLPAECVPTIDFEGSGMSGATLTWADPNASETVVHPPPGPRLSVPEMTPDRWRQVQWLFDAVLLREPSERPSFLEQATLEDPSLRSEVLSLIRSLKAASRFIDQPAQLGHGDESEVFAPGARVGAYKLVRLLGSGGVGRVYLADRADDAFEKQVAVKVIKRGMDTDELVRRFVSERQILARLQHPNISQLVDGGATDDGRPFLVMEYVDGVPIDLWCQHQRLDVTARLELFLAVCDAVQFAHRNLVIHRDLKPGNILVARDGVAKLLDFGIAKLISPESFPETVFPTAPGWRAMTPEYASPEQVLGDVVTTASDVYSLGVVLYELLTGFRPYKITEYSPAAIELAVCHKEPIRASRKVRENADAGRLERRLTGDLDDILTMALEKDPEHRYSTVDQLAADLRRHLDGLPVMARKGTFLYRTGKFVRRNRLAVGVSSLIFLLLLFFLATLWTQQRQTLRQRGRAELVSSFLVDLFAIPDPSRERGAAVTARALLDKGTRDVEAQLRGQPGLLGDMLATMGATYTNLGFYLEAEPLLQRSLALRSKAYGPRDPSIAASKQQLAILYLATGDLKSALRLNQEALDLRLDLHGSSHQDVAESQFRLAKVRQRLRDVAAADDLFAEAEHQARQLELDDLLIRVLSRRGSMAWAWFRNEADAGAYLAEALTIAERVWGEIHPEVAIILNNLAEIERHHDIDRARELWSRALEIQRVIYREPHPDVAQLISNLAVLDKQMGRLAEAEAGFREALAVHRLINPDQGILAAAVINNLAGVLKDQGQVTKAERLYLESLEIHQRLLGPGHEATANVLSNLGEILQSTGRVDEAEVYFRDALEILIEANGDEHARVGIVHNNLAKLAMGRGDLDDAEKGFETAARLLRATSPPRAELPTVLQNQAALAGKRGDGRRSEALYQEALEILDVLGSENTSIAALIRCNLAVAGIRAGDHVAAEEWARGAMSIYEQIQPPGSSDQLRTRRLLAIALLRQKRFAEVEPLAKENLEMCEERSGAEQDEGNVECAPHVKVLASLYERWGADKTR